MRRSASVESPFWKSEMSNLEWRRKAEKRRRRNTAEGIGIQDDTDNRMLDAYAKGKLAAKNEAQLNGIRRFREKDSTRKDAARCRHLILVGDFEEVRRRESRPVSWEAKELLSSAVRQWVTVLNANLFLQWMETSVKALSEKAKEIDPLSTVNKIRPALQREQRRLELAGRDGKLAAFITRSLEAQAKPQYLIDAVLDLLPGKCAA